MPTYVYRCQNCDTVLERFQKITDDPLTTHEECGGPLRRVLQPVGIVFKGSGFYVTDYKRGENGSSGKSAESTNGKTEASKSESTESKPAAEKAEKKETAKPAAAAT